MLDIDCLDYIQLCGQGTAFYYDDSFASKLVTPTHTAIGFISSESSVLFSSLLS